MTELLSQLHVPQAETKRNKLRSFKGISDSFFILTLVTSLHSMQAFSIFTLMYTNGSPDKHAVVPPVKPLHVLEAGDCS